MFVFDIKINVGLGYQNPSFKWQCWVLLSVYVV